MQSLSGNQRPDLLASLMNMSLVLRLQRDMHLCRSSSSVPRLPSFLEMLQNPHVLLTFGKAQNPLPRKTTSEPSTSSTVVWACGAFNILTSKMCFAQQRRALFRHVNFQKRSDAEVFVHFDLEMCFAPQLRAIVHLSAGQMAPHPPL